MKKSRSSPKGKSEGVIVIPATPVPGSTAGTLYPATCSNSTEAAKNAFWAHINHLDDWPGTF